MEIHHLGAKECVTGSCHLVVLAAKVNKTEQVSILVDCGKAYGKDPELGFDKFPVPPAKIDYLFLTHAHIDHIGRVPDLLAAGFKGEIICTHATKALLLPMLRDSLSFSNKSRQEIQVIETDLDDLSWGFEYNEVFHLRNGIEFRLGNAGHILGSCFIEFCFPLPKDKTCRVTFSGDLGAINTPILPDPDPPGACDLLVLESTYGDRVHEGREHRIRALKQLLEKALADRGLVYIPAFSLGRTQELIYELDRIKKDVPVFIDSPLGLQITEIYSTLEAFWDKESKALKRQGDHPLDFRNLYAVERFRDHKRLLRLKGPGIIIAGSGMCTGGRITAHLEHGLDDPNNDIFFVGYQAKGTPGRKILEGRLKVKAGVHSLSGYSAHADQRMLVDWVNAMPKRPKEIRLVHGGTSARKALADKLSLTG